MKRTACLALLVAATLTACAPPTPEQQIINDAAAALGGRENIQAVKTLAIEGEGTNVEADVYTPGAAVHPFAANLLENIKKHNLRIDRIVPIHGTIGPYNDLVKASQTPSTN